MIVSIKPAYLDRTGAALYVSLSEGMLEKLVRAGDFPRPRQLSAGRVGWRVAELEEWADTRPVSTLPPPPNTGARKPAKAAPLPVAASVQTSA